MSLTDFIADLLSGGNPGREWDDTPAEEQGHDGDDNDSDERRPVAAVGIVAAAAIL